VRQMFAAERTELFQLQFGGGVLLVFAGSIIPSLAPAARKQDIYTHIFYSTISETTPAPTVRPPSRMANLKPGSMAIGTISSTSKVVLSPGITISTPSANVTTPVTSVVRK